MKLTAGTILKNLMIATVAVSCFYFLLKSQHLLHAHRGLVFCVIGILLVYFLVRILLYIDQTKRHCEDNPYCVYFGNDTFSAWQDDDPNRRSLMRDARARIISGEMPMEVIEWLTEHGVPIDHANNGVCAFMQERSVVVRSKGVIHILRAVAIVVAAALVATTVYFLNTMGYIDVRPTHDAIAVLTAVLACLSLYLLFRGVYLLRITAGEN